MFIDIAFLSDTFLKLCAALPVTLGLFICSFLCGGILAVGVLALRMSRWPLLSGFAKGYILVFRGSPLLIQLFLIYYGLGQFGVIRHSFCGRCCANRLSARCWRWRCVPPLHR
jgi:octopine/nopaline transport system permease protein